MTGLPSAGVRAAFTLVELLVVISVIAILVAMLLPAFGKAKLSSVTINCANVERQMMSAMGAYSADNKGGIPPINDYGPTNAQVNTWYLGPTDIILAANTNRYALAGAYGNRVGIGHLLGGGYFGAVDNLRACCEPTFALPSSVIDSPTALVSYFLPIWKAQGLTGSTISAPSLYTVINGYTYRGWLGDVDNYPVWVNALIDKRRTPNIDRMFDRAAVWCMLESHNFGVKAIPLTHPNGYNVGYFDGHVKFVPDQDGRITINQYGSYMNMSSEMIKDRFDPSVDP